MTGDLPGAGIRLVMADDHAPTRGLIRRALEEGGCEVCGEGADAYDAIALALEHEPDAVLLDIHMPGNGIHAAQEIAAALPQTAIVMLTASQEDEDLFEALQAGASGYLLKTTDPQTLPGALRAVLAGEAALPPRLVARVLDEFRAPKQRLRRRPVQDRLSPREREVMQALSEGGTTEEVARRLFISTTTVRVHVSTVLRKLQVKDRESAFRLMRGEQPPSG